MSENNGAAPEETAPVVDEQQHGAPEMGEMPEIGQSFTKRTGSGERVVQIVDEAVECTSFGSPSGSWLVPYLDEDGDRAVAEIRQEGGRWVEVE